MKQMVRYFSLTLLLLVGHAASTSLDMTLENTSYVRHDSLDPNAHVYNHSESFSAALEKLGATNLSLYSDAGFSNSFLNPARKKFDLRTFYLDAPVFSNFDAKIGRQRVYDLVSKGDYLDAIKLDYEVARKARFHAYAGAPVPSLYGNEFLKLDPTLLQSGLGVDAMVHPSTWVGAQVGHTKDSSGMQRTPIAGFVESRIGTNLGLKANAEYDAEISRIDEFSLDISGRPVAALECRAYMLGESQAIDSTDAFERLLLGKHTDVGLQLGWNGHGTHAHGYYSLRILEHGADHLGGIAVNVNGIILDAETGNGVSGSSVKMTGGYAHDCFQSLRCGAAVSAYYFKLSQNPAREHSWTTRAYANWMIPGSGISIDPEVQYLSNEYFRTDVRFLLTIQYHILTFWKS